MTKMTSFFKLIRWPNLLMMATILAVVRFGFLIPLGFDVVLAWPWFALLMLSTILIAAGGNAVNDANDVMADRFNKPEKMAIGKNLTKETALFIGQALLLLGSFGGLALGYFNQMITFSYIFPLAALILWVYARSLKRLAFFGNVSVAFLAGLLVFNVAIFDLLGTLTGDERDYQMQAVYVVMALAGFSFALTLARELIKDLQDIDGDRRAGYKTLPIISGTSIAKILAILILMVVTVCLGWLLYKTVAGSDWFSGVYLFIFVILPLLYSIIAIAPASSYRAFGRISGTLKWVMITGLFSLLIFTLSVKYILA